MTGPSVAIAFRSAVEWMQPTGADPGFGATVSTPSPWALIAAWVVGIIILAVLWALARR